MTRRVATIAVAGMLAGVMAAGVGTASAQVTQSGVKEKAKATMQAGQVKWESLTPARQQELIAEWNTTKEAAQAKWESLPPTQQQELKTKAVAAGAATKKKWQSLPK